MVFDIIDLSANLTERKLSENASLKKWLCIKIRLWVKIVEIPSFPPAYGGGGRYYQLTRITTQNLLGVFLYAVVDFDCNL
jgi:hypothetical protein